MKTLNLIGKIGFVLYLVIVGISLAFNLARFEVVDKVMIVVLKIMYFIFLVFAMYSFYKSKSKNELAVILFTLPIFLCFTGIPFKIVTMILVLTLFFLKGLNTAIRVIGIVLYLILITIGIYGLGLGDFVSKTQIGQVYSPDKTYKLIIMDCDEGALGGGTCVYLEQNYFGVIERYEKTIYSGDWGQKPTVIWLDKSTVKVDDKIIKVR